MEVAAVFFLLAIVVSILWSDQRRHAMHVLDPRAQLQHHGQRHHDGPGRVGVHRLEAVGVIFCDAVLLAAIHYPLLIFGFFLFLRFGQGSKLGFVVRARFHHLDGPVGAVEPCPRFQVQRLRWRYFVFATVLDLPLGPHFPIGGVGDRLGLRVAPFLDAVDAQEMLDCGDARVRIDDLRRDLARIAYQHRDQRLLEDVAALAVLELAEQDADDGMGLGLAQSVLIRLNRVRVLPLA